MLHFGNMLDDLLVDTAVFGNKEFPILNLSL